MAEAASWYERHRLGLGGEFLEAVDAAVVRTEENPSVGSQPAGVEDEQIRRILVRRFPFAVVYIELPDRVQILAVAHARRRPAYWRSLLSS